MKNMKTLWLLVLGMALILGAGTALATPEAAAEAPADQAAANALVTDSTTCSISLTKEPVPGELPAECELDPDTCCEMYPDSEFCGNNVWCCKPVNGGTDRVCQKILPTKCAAAPAGVVYPSEGRCLANC